MEQHRGGGARSIPPKFQLEVMIVRQSEGAAMAGQQAFARTVPTSQSQSVCVIQIDSKADAAATIEADKRLQERASALPAGASGGK
jgi:hypothetical protein